MLLLRYALGIGVLTWVIAGSWHLPGPDGEDFGLAAALARPMCAGRLTAVVVLTATSLALTVVRWYLLVRAQGLPFGLRNAFRLGLVGYAASTFLPGSVGGDLLKAAFIAREQKRRTAAAATVVFDRVIGMSGLYSLAAIAGMLLWGSGLLGTLVAEELMRAVLLSAAAASAMIALGLLGLWLVLRRLPAGVAARLDDRLGRIPKVGPLLAEVWRATWMYRTRGRVVAVAWMLSVANHMVNALLMYSAATALSPPADVPPLTLHFLLVPVGNTVQASFPSPGGVGGGEYGYGLLYQRLGAPFAAGVLAALTARAATWLVGFVGYVVYLGMRREEGVAPQINTHQPE
jgi:uncharacterized protein (TIRG00374 family)